MFEVTYENCQYCEYCNTENGQSDWYCSVTDELYSELDHLPCQQERG